MSAFKKTFKDKDELNKEGGWEGIPGHLMAGIRKRPALFSQALS